MNGLKIGLVGPLPPPSGGMANQTRQLARLLEEAGAQVTLVQVNAPYKPAWIGRVQSLRALFRLLPYLWALWRTAGKVQLFHIMANSGWSWHLFAAPAIWIGWMRGVRVVVNYRGGEAEAFFRHSFRWIRPSLERVTSVVVPSGFLEAIFDRHGVATRIVPNIIDTTRFPATGRQRRGADRGAGPHLLVTRNLEPIYDIDTALRALAGVHERLPGASMTVCGSGPERSRLEALAESLGLSAAVTFTGRVENERMADLYRSADVVINPSLADNMPISVLESLASGVPVVSTRVGGVPYLVEDGRNALLVDPGDAQAMARAVITLVQSPGMADRLVNAGLEEVRRYTWPEVRKQLQAVYLDALQENAAEGAPG